MNKYFLLALLMSGISVAKGHGLTGRQWKNVLATLDDAATDDECVDRYAKQVEKALMKLSQRDRKRKVKRPLLVD